MAYIGQSMPTQLNARKADIFSQIDLVAITLALAVFAFPIAALLTTVTGLFENTLSIASRLVTAVAAVVLFANRLFQGKLKFPHWALSAFLLMYSTRLLWEYFVEKIPEAADAGLFFLASTIIPVFALACVRPSDWDEIRVTKTLFVASSLFIALAWWVFVFQGQELVTHEYLKSVGGRRGVERLNSIYLGTTAVSCFLFATSLLIQVRTIKTKVMACLVMVFSFYITYLAASRGPIVGLIVCLGVMFGQNIRGLLLCALTGVLVLVATALSYIDWANVLEKLRFDNIGEDVNSTSRFDLMSQGISEFNSSPLFGSGHCLPTIGCDGPHNIFVEVLMATGVVGMLVFLFALVPALFSSVRTLRSGSAIVGILFIQYLTGSQFSGTIWGNSTLWLSLGLVLSVVVGQREFRNKLRRRPIMRPVNLRQRPF
jgi:O-Antigen ligase